MVPQTIVSRILKRQLRQFKGFLFWWWLLLMLSLSLLRAMLLKGFLLVCSAWTSSARLTFAIFASVLHRCRTRVRVWPVLPVHAASEWEVVSICCHHRGDQLTFVTVQKLQGEYEVNYARIVLNPRNADGSGAPMTTEIVNSEGEFPCSHWKNGRIYHRARADHTRKSHEASTQSGLYQCRDNQFERRTLQWGRSYLLPDEPGEGQRNGILLKIKFFNVGECYYHGKGVEQSVDKAFEWYMKAADMGDMQAQVNVANAYYLSNGVHFSCLVH